MGNMKVTMTRLLPFPASREDIIVVGFVELQRVTPVEIQPQKEHPQVGLEGCFWPIAGCLVRPGADAGLRLVRQPLHPLGILLIDHGVTVRG